MYSRQSDVSAAWARLQHRPYRDVNQGEIIAEPAPSNAKRSRPTRVLRSPFGTSAELSNRVNIQMQRIGRVTKIVITAAGIVALGLVAADPADAQTQTWEGTGYFSINYGYQQGDRAFQETLTATVYDEEASYLVEHTSIGGGQFDIGGGLRVWRNLAVGLAVTAFSTSAGAAITGTVPHPLFFDLPRVGSSTRTDLEHKELGFHFEAAWVIPLNEKISVTGAGGPSLFKVNQDLVTAVGVPQELGSPYTTVALGTVETTSASESGVGANVGIDVTYLLTERFGGGLFVRWAGGTVDLPASGGSQSIDVGGVQAGIGLRVRF